MALGMTEGRLIETLGKPEGEMRVGDRIIYTWPSVKVKLVDGVVRDIERRQPVDEVTKLAIRRKQIEAAETRRLEIKRRAEEMGKLRENFSEYYIDIVETGDFEATFSASYRFPELYSGTISTFAPKPPTIGLQSVSSIKLTSEDSPDLPVQSVDDLNQGRKMSHLPVEVWRLGTDRTLDIKVTYAGKLYRKELTKGANPRAKAEVPTLSVMERVFYTAKTATMDWGEPNFQSWLDMGELRRRDGESNLDFGKRCYDYLMENGIYGGDTSSYSSRRPSEVCRTMSNDCGGLSLLFVAAMRANGIPARSLFGRWARCQTNSYGQFHVIAEFYDDRIGWIPVDISAGLEQPDQHFGRAGGNLIVFHIDTDISPLDGFVHGWAQYPLLYVDSPSLNAWADFSEKTKWSVEFLQSGSNQ